MAAAHSKLSNGVLLALAGACFATSIAIIYLLRRQVRDPLLEEDENRSVQSSRYAVVEVPVPADIVGAVIGRYGCNIEQMQKATSTKINFKDEANEEGCRMAVIRGKPADVHAAERLLLTTVADRMNVTTEEIKIPVKACGAVIGKSGSNIRFMCETSRAKIKVDTVPTRDSYQRVTIRGTSSEILSAKMLIEEKVAEAQERESKNAQILSAAASHAEYEGRRLLCDAPAVLERRPAPAVEQLTPTEQDGFMEVFISSVQSPDRFWVQPVGVNFSTELDKLNEKITQTCEPSDDSEESPLTELKEGDIVAAKFSNDEKWYRASVCSVVQDDYEPGNSDVELFYADFGDYASSKLKDLKPLEPEYRRLPFQAVECRLANVRPLGGTWSAEASQYFEDVTFCCQWLTIMLRVVKDSDDKSAWKTVELVDTRGDFDNKVADALIKAGYAVPEPSLD